MSAFSREAGISTLVCLAVTALRIRVSMSAIGSVIYYSLAGPHPRSLMPRVRRALRACGRWHGRRRFLLSRLCASRSAHPVAQDFCPAAVAQDFCPAARGSPAALRDARHVAFERELAEAQAA